MKPIWVRVKSKASFGKKPNKGGSPPNLSREIESKGLESLNEKRDGEVFLV